MGEREKEKEGNCKQKSSINDWAFKKKSLYVNITSKLADNWYHYCLSFIKASKKKIRLGVRKSLACEHPSYCSQVVHLDYFDVFN